jgi:hypothetical protein
MHGGDQGSGRPKGTRNGNYKRGRRQPYRPARSRVEIRQVGR